MDNAYLDKLQAIDLLIELTPEDDSVNVVNNKYIFLTTFLILEKSKVPIIIGRQTIQKHSLISKFPCSFFFKRK